VLISFCIPRLGIQSATSRISNAMTNFQVPVIVELNSRGQARSEAESDSDSDSDTDTDAVPSVFLLFSRLKRTEEKLSCLFGFLPHIEPSLGETIAMLRAFPDLEGDSKLERNPGWVMIIPGT